MNTLCVMGSILKIQITAGLQYRLSALAGASTGIFVAIIECVIMLIFYTYSDYNTAGLAAGMSLQQAISYIWLAQLIFVLQPQTDPAITEQITNGNIGIELCRPLNIYTNWFARLGSARIAPFILRGLPVLIAALLMPSAYRLAPPVSLYGFLAMLAALLGALLLSASFAAFAQALLLNIHWGTGPVNMLLVFANLMSGVYFPLQLWPDTMQRLLILQPFAGMTDIPVRLYIGTMPVNQLLPSLGIQLFWIIVFILLGKWIVRRNLSRLVVQGG